MSTYRTQPALRVEPGRLSRLVADLEGAAIDGRAAVAAIDQTISDYDARNAGPDVTVVVASGTELVAGFESILATIDDVAVTVDDARLDLLAVEADSDRLWAQVRALGPPGDDPELEARLSGEFWAIRHREDRILDAVATALSGSAVGATVVLDTAAVSDVIGRDAASVGPGVQVQIEAALALATDYGDDGDFDLPPIVIAPGATIVDLPDPTATGDWDGWWLWRSFTPDDYDISSMWPFDVTPDLAANPSSPSAVTPFNARQGAIGDCYFVAAVSSLANTPEGRAHLGDMVINNGDGTYTVTYGDGVSVTVDSDIYVSDDGSPAYGGSAEDAYNWFSVLEKSFAGRTDSSYDEIEGGWMVPAWELLLGEGEATRVRDPSADELSDIVIDDLGNDRPVAIGLDLNDIDDGYDDGSLHAFSVLAVDEAAGTVTLRNPWGSNNGDLGDGLEDDYEASLGDDGTFTIPIDHLAPIVHTYESYEVATP